jgi:arylsulfatase A
MKKLNLIIILITVSVITTVAQSPSGRPNIILILADDLGYGDLGCYGQQKIHTPNIDALANKGIRFTQFYAGSTVCAPSRASLMTGMHTGHTPVRGNKGMLPEGQTPLPDSVVTFATLLSKSGYTTAAFGKWGLGFITTSGDPQKQGFDLFYGYNCQTLAHNYYPDHLWKNHERVDLSVNLSTDSIYSADIIQQQAIDFLNEKHDQPFFLYLPFTLPHADVIVPHDSIYAYYVNKFDEPAKVIPTAKDEEKSHYDPYPHAAFAAMVSRLDRYVGEIMHVLSEKRMEENTLVIFTSDNGPHREKGGDPDFFSSSGGLRGIKRDVYEGGIREPFIAYQKGFTKPGTVNKMPMALWDLYPTFLQIARIPIPKNIDGFSIVAALKDRPLRSHSYFYWELHEGGGKQAVRMGEWKGVRLNVTTSVDARVELYNLKKDPRETNNVAAQFPEVAKKIETIMTQSHVDNKDWPLFKTEVKTSASQ